MGAEEAREARRLARVVREGGEARARALLCAIRRGAANAGRVSLPLYTRLCAAALKLFGWPLPSPTLYFCAILRAMIPCELRAVRKWSAMRMDRCPMTDTERCDTPTGYGYSSLAEISILRVS